MEQDEPPKQPEPSHRPRADESSEIIETLFRVTKIFMVPFLLSWMLAYGGGQLNLEWVYYAGLGGVALSIVGLLMWLLHQ